MSVKDKKKTRKMPTYSEEIKIALLERVHLGETVADAAKALGVPYHSARRWAAGETAEIKEIKKVIDYEELEELRKEQKAEFVKAAWENIRLAITLIHRRLTRAVEQEEQIDKLLEAADMEIEALIPQEYSQKTAKRTLYKQIAELKLEDISKLSIVMGTQYDKQALASNENTQNIGLNRKLEDFIKDLSNGD